MKKTIRTAIAMLLAAIIACGSITAFAATPTDINWYFGGDDPWVYTYAGEFTVGDASNNIEATEESLNVYGTFEIEEEGYYRVTSTYYFTEWAGIPEKFENGAYHNTKNSFSVDGYIREDIYYFEADEYVLGFDFYEKGNEEVTIEFLGDLEEIKYDENAFESLIIDFSIYTADEDDGCGADYYIDVLSGATVKFSNGYERTVDYVGLCVFTDEVIEKGEYEVEIGHRAFPYRETVTLNVVDIPDIIAKVEMTNVDKYDELVYHYNGDYYSYDIEDETLTVTYTDGTVETVEGFNGWCYLEKYGIWVEAFYDYDEELGDVFVVEVFNERYIELPCTYRDATISENLGQYGAINLRSITNAIEWLGFYFENAMNAGSVSGFFSGIKYMITESTSDFLMAMSTILSNTARLIRYYF